MIYMAYVLHGFYLDTATVAAGTEIRPMGLTYVILVTAIGSILCGGACALIGGIVGFIHRRWMLVLVAFRWLC